MTLELSAFGLDDSLECAGKACHSAPWTARPHRENARSGVLVRPISIYRNA
jgi:hypothetical protein